MTIHKVILPEAAQVIEATPIALPSRPTMPPEIAAAVCVVMGQITTLSKDERNKFQNYDYVSVDQFYALVGPLMAEAGIFTMLYEKSMDVGERKTTSDRGDTKASVWLSACYDVWIYHKSGAAFGPVERSITVPASGAQSYASAISFVEKYYLRSLFKIPTGDGDEDGAPKRDLPANGRRNDRPNDTHRPAVDDATSSKTFYIGQAEREWAKVTSREGMTKWWNDHKDAMGDIFDGNSDPLYADLKAKYQAHGKTLPATVEAA